MKYFDSLCSNFEGTEARVIIGEGGKVLKSSLSGKIAIEAYSTISRSEVCGYLGMGCFSLVSRSDVERYVTIGSRVSVGAFNHPTGFFSVMEFQYRSCLDTYGEEIEERRRVVVDELGVTEIGGDVWIGDNAFVKAGVKVATGSIIGACSVVTKDTLPYHIYAGNPARVIRARMPEALISRYLSSAWWRRLDISDLASVEFRDQARAIEQVEEIIRLKEAM